MLIHYLRYTVRLLRKSPGFTAVAVVTLALGIGANTAVFSVIDAVMLRPLPYAEPARLVELWEGRHSRPSPIRAGGSAVAPANLVDYISQNRSFAGLAGYDSTSMSLTKSGAPEQVLGEAVTWNYFSILGVQPALGRAFAPEEDRRGRSHVVVLSDSLWRGRYGADPAIFGRSITLDGQPYEVVGVMPAGFRPLTQYAATTPVIFFVPAAYPDDLLAQHGDHEISVVGRLKAGVSAEQAQADLDGITSDLARRFPRSNSDIRAQIAPLADDIARNVRTSLVVLLGAVALVLLIACVNVANLLIVRAIGQRREVAIRMALGASRRQIVLDLMTRGVVLGAMGGLAGLLCGVWARDALVAVAPASIPRLNELSLSPNVLVVTAALSLLTGVLAGLLPAMQSARAEAAPTLKASELTASGARSVMRWRGVLMASEVAAALVLAVAAGLLVRSLSVLTRVDLGFQAEQVLAANINLPDTSYPTADKRLAFFQSLESRVRSIPGVQSVAFANRLPMRGGWGSSVMLAGGPAPTTANADFQAVSPGYFTTLGIPLLRGRLLSDDDRAGTMRVAMVSQTFVRQFLAERDPIGRQFRRNPGAPVITIVGVVGEVRRDGKSAKLLPEVYLPAAQTDLYPVHLGDFAVRTAGDPHALVAAMQRAVWAIDPDQPITNVKTLDEVLSASMAERRFNLLLLTAFAALAVVLAMVGVYGIAAFAATERTREIGIRVALGAARRDVIALVVGEGLRWAVAGVIVGLAGAYATTRLMTGLLFGVAPTDAATFATIAALMVGVALGASYLPARRAAAVDPVAALRSE